MSGPTTRPRDGKAWRIAVGAGGALVGTVGTACAQTLGHGPPDDISLWRVAMALILCLVLAVGAAFAVKAGGGRWRLPFVANDASRRLKLRESLRLGHQVDLCIVACDGRDLLVSVSAQGVRLLDRLPAPDGRDGQMP